MAVCRASIRLICARLHVIDRSLDPLIQARFARDLAALWDARRGRLVVAVSGGPDSVALLLLAHAALPGRVAALTVDHGLRPESVAEAAQVAHICDVLGADHATLSVELEAGNTQANARVARYHAMAEWLARHGQPGDALATAHHADDQAETLLMRLNRGSGLSGLAGIRPKRALSATIAPGVQLIRPLLGWRRDELRDVAEAAGAPFVNDPSNEDERFDRVRLRHALSEADWLDPVRLARSAAHLAEASAFLAELAQQAFAERVSEAAGGFAYRPAMQPLIDVEVILRILAHLGGQALRSEARLMRDRLVRGENASLSGVLAKAKQGQGGEATWVFAPEPPRKG